MSNTYKVTSIVEYTRTFSPLSPDAALKFIIKPTVDVVADTAEDAIEIIKSLGVLNASVGSSTTSKFVGIASLVLL